MNTRRYSQANVNRMEELAAREKLHIEDISYNGRWWRVRLLHGYNSEIFVVSSLVAPTFDSLYDSLDCAIQAYMSSETITALKYQARIEELKEEHAKQIELYKSMLDAQASAPSQQKRRM